MTTFVWNGNSAKFGGTSDLGTAANWISTNAFASIPTASDSLTFNSRPGILTGTVQGLNAAFSGVGTWDLLGAQLTLAGLLTVDGALTIAGGSVTAGSVAIKAGAALSGRGAVTGAITDDGTITASGGLLTLSGPVGGTGLLQIDVGATLDVNSASAGETISFLGSTGTLADHQVGTIGAAISGFVAGDTIDLTSLTFAPGAAATIAGGVLTVTSGATSETLHLTGISNATTFSVTADATGIGTDITIGPAPPPPSSTQHDFNGDGKSDIVWQNDNGTPAIWLMNGTTKLPGAALPNPGPTWHIMGTGDFNGDGKSDIVWQNDNGRPAIWLMNGTTALSGAALPNPGPAWHIMGTGDFNGDGKSDIVWQNDNGTPAIWLMNGTTALSGAALPNPGPTWHIMGTGDFNGDGKSDIVWQNDNGTPAIWLMNGTTKLPGAALPNPGPTWHIMGTGDFNGDGKSDIVWQNDNGTPTIWLMNGTTKLSGAALPNPGPTWHIMGTGDFNGDGKSDIVWQNDNGTPAIWLMNGTKKLPGAALPHPGPTWHIMGMGDRMHFINGTSSAGTLVATSQADEFALTSHATGLETISGFDPRQDILELSKAHFTNFTDVQAHTVASAGGALLALDSASSLLLSGVAPGQLHTTNFVFA